MRDLGPHYYILDAHHVAIPTDSDTYARWLAAIDRRRVAKTRCGKGVYVSTVFLGLDHSYGDGAPELFETMVFGGPLAHETVRYATWAQAEAGHAAMVARVQAAARPR